MSQEAMSDLERIKRLEKSLADLGVPLYIQKQEHLRRLRYKPIVPRNSERIVSGERQKKYWAKVKEEKKLPPIPELPVKEKRPRLFPKKKVVPKPVVENPFNFLVTPTPQSNFNMDEYLKMAADSEKLFKRKKKK